jgi:RimJ/RimL family protein N-acetyltransferase
MGEEPVPGAIMLSGARVALGPVREDLVVFYNDLRNDLMVQKTAGLSFFPVSIPQTRAMVDAPARDTASDFTVYRHDTWQPIGSTNLRDIDFFHGTAEFGIQLHRSAWNQGFGTETAQLILAYAFQMLNLHNVYLTVDGANPRGQRAYEKAGFRAAGRYRQAVIVDRERVDLIHMDCLASEFAMPEKLTWGPPE